MKVGMKNGTSQSAIASVVGTLGLVLALGAPALADTYSTQYEMSGEPTIAANVLDSNAGDANGNGLLSVATSGTGSTFAGGIMHFIDNVSTNTGNLGYYFNQAAAADITYTIDMRVKANNNAVGPAPRSMGFNGGTNKGGGLLLNKPGGGSCTVGSTQLNTTGSTEWCLDLSTFHRLRVVVNGTTSSIKVYDLDNPTSGPGSDGLIQDSISVSGGGFNGDPVGGIPNGGFHIGSVSGGNTTATDFEVDYVRVLLSTAVNDSTTVIDQLPAPSCLVTVTPSSTVTATGFELGATPAPTPIPYSINNLGSTTINYTATEVDALGVAFSYPWLSLSSAGGSVIGGSNDTVTATMDTTTLSAGTHTAYVKFTDDCPVSPAFTETFTYANSNLNGNAGWAGTATTEIVVTGNEVHMPGGAGGFDAINASAICSADGTGIISAKFKIKNVSGGGSTMWRLEFRDPANNIFCDVGGTANTLNLRNAQNNEFVLAVPLVSTYTHFELRIHTASDKLELYDITTTPTLLGTAINIGTVGGIAAGDSVGKLRLERRNNSGAAGHELAFDDFELSVIQPHIRRINLELKGCEITVQEPRHRVLGQCNPSSITTEVFTIKNTGSADWTGFTVIEDGDDDDWLTYSFTSSPVARFATATVTITIDWTQVPITFVGDDQVSHLQFSASCDGGATFDNDELSGAGNLINDIVIMDSTALPVLSVVYNGDVDPSVNDSAGTGVKFELFDTSINLGGVVSDPGVGQATDGLAYHADDNNAAAQMKWRTVLNGGGAGPNIDSTVGATALARVKTISASSTQGGNLSILENSISGSYHWGGPNNIAKETIRGDFATPSGDNAYHIIRITSLDTLGPDGRVVTLYLDENPTAVVTISNASSSNGSSNLDAFGFGVGSNSGLQDIYFDWVSATNVGAFAPGEEVSCIGSLIPESTCFTPRVDADDDEDVDMDDFAVFQTCYTGDLGASPPPLSQLCDCFDVDNSNEIDIADFNAFVECETGAGVLWVSSVNCPN